MGGLDGSDSCVEVLLLTRDLQRKSDKKSLLEEFNKELLGYLGPSK